jgi:hypothetical protein
MPSLLQRLGDAGILAEPVEVPYEFQLGANQMLRLGRRSL